MRPRLGKIARILFFPLRCAWVFLTPDKYEPWDPAYEPCTNCINGSIYYLDGCGGSGEETCPVCHGEERLLKPGRQPRDCRTGFSSLIP